MADSDGVISAVSQWSPLPGWATQVATASAPGAPALHCTLSLNSQKYVIADPSLAGNSNMRQHETLFSEYLIQRNVSDCFAIICQFECTARARERVRVTWEPRPGAGPGSWLPDTAQVHTNTNQPPPPPAHSILNTNCQKLVVKLSRRL